ncbi:unnamed protein product [Ceutorhynchus assimilis]|uniref:BTB domain-containing protein n=1 Tax=Ceutorhynchus assimilis TaxID=467358 RepID=A0A9N9MV93_9CUCU|nr:unnamed protein product [Ceutorhynchus assimilis]
MGVRFSTQNILDNVTNFVSGRKRKHEETEENKVIEVALHTPKRKKLLCTANYIYQTLFIDGKNSDITVCALGKEHRLHRIYLCQSPYFASMFGGSWLESTEEYIKIDIIDPSITLKSLQVVFGSLYSTEIEFNPLEIVSVLATATMFQLDGLIEKCTEIMMETINIKTALGYYQASCRYGDKKLQEVCIDWFLVNLMSHYFNNSDKDLGKIPKSLMLKLVAHPNLFTIQTEYTVYVMLKYWIYIRNHPNESFPHLKTVNNYFWNRTDDTPYVYCADEGNTFYLIFKELRLQNLILHDSDIALLIKDNIIPKPWVTSVALKQWKHVLRINQNDETGPVDVPIKLFLQESIRCGREITSKTRNTWRWAGFHFGIDLLMITDDNKVYVKRSHRSDYEQLLSFQTTRHLAIRVTVACLNEQKQIACMKQSDIQTLSLTKGEEVKLMTLDEDNMHYPLFISVNLLFTTPVQNQSEQNNSNRAESWQ